MLGPRQRNPKSVRTLSMPWLLLCVAVALAYLGSGWAGLLLAHYEAEVTLLWPPTGISLAALLIFGRRLWPGVLLGALSVNLVNGLGPASCVLIATGNTLAAVCGATLLRRLTAFRRELDSLNDILSFGLFGGLVATMVSASVGSVTLCLDYVEWSGWPSIWLTWWLGDTGGVLTFGTAILLWAARESRSIRAAGGGELTIALVAVAVSGVVIFGGTLDWAGQSVAFLPFPLLMWVALRGGPRLAATSSLGVVLIAVWGTMQGHGPFAVPDFANSMALLWLFMVVATSTTSILAAAIAERSGAELQLRENQARLQLLNSIATGMTVGTPLEDVLERIVVNVAEYFPRYRVNYSACDSAGSLAVEIARGPDDMPAIEGAAIDLGRAPAYLAALNRGPVVVYDVFLDPRFDPLAESLESMGIRALLDVPVHHSGELVGLLGLDASEPHQWTEHEVRTFVEVGQLIALMLRDEQNQRDRRDLQAQVQHSQKLEGLGVLAGGIAHDFNNLLTTMLGNAELVLMSLPGDAKSVRGNVESIREASLRAADLCSQMLAYAGRNTLSREPIDLNGVIRGTVELIEVSISKKTRIRYHLDESMPQVFGDTTQIRQVLMNLIINGSEAGEGGDVNIDVTTESVECDRAMLKRFSFDNRLAVGTYVRLDIRDDGCGMDEDTRSRLFDPFFTTKFAGRGLGLAAVLGIVRSHHGAIRVESKVGVGTRVTVLLPTSETAAEQYEDGPRESSTWRSEGTVLLVDDELEVRRVGSGLLASAGLRVVTAKDGVEALERFREFSDEIVCVLLDLTMPRMDGPETLQELRKIRPDVPVVLCSGFGEAESIEKLAEHEVVGFVAKPYTGAVLLDKVRKAVERYRASR